MIKKERMDWRSGSLMAVGAAIFFAAQGVTAALAETKVFGCAIVERYSSSQVQIALEHARAFVDEGEISRLYGQYLSLKNECRSNPGARRVVHVSSRMGQMIAGQ